MSVGAKGRMSRWLELLDGLLEGRLIVRIGLLGET
jgi:hypothetical protein